MAIKKYVIISFLVICFTSIFSNVSGSELNILCTTFPIFQFTRNITKDCKDVRTQLMLPSQLGCPHDYALTPQDMHKLAKADVLVANGLGLEEFLGAPIKKINPKLIVINSSKGVNNTLPYAGCKHHKHSSHCKHGHQPTKANPHLFASPDLAAKLVQYIAGKLADINPPNAQTYKQNAQIYTKRLTKLAREMASLGKKLKNNRIVQPHGVFDYLARDIGLDIVATMQPHGQEPSAAEMMAIVKKIKQHKVGAIFTEPQYPQKTARTIAKEAGIKLATLDPVASGPANAPLDYYSTVMRKNMATLRKILGAK